MATPLEMADARSRAARAATQAWPRASTLTLLRSHVAGLSILVLFQIIGSLATLVPLLAIVELGRILWGPGTADSSRIWFVVLFGAAGLLIRLAFTGAATAVGHVIDGRAQLSLRLRVASHLGRAPLAWLIRRRSVELSKVVGDDISALHPVIAHTPAQLVDAFVVPAASLIYLLSIDWRMTLITLIPVGAAIAMVPLMMTPAKLDAEREFDAAMSSLRTSLVELVRGIRVVKTFGGPERTGLRFRRAVNEFVSSFERWVRGMAGPAAGMQLALSPPVMLLSVLVGGALLIDGGQLKPVDLLPFLLLGIGLAAPVAALGHGFDELQAARLASDRVREVLAVRPLPLPVEPSTPDGSRVEFCGVNLSYDDHPVLDGIDLVLEPGTTTAIVGPSGSGKSTLAHLLLRFADPTDGRIELGGADLRDLDTGTLNRSIAAVLQDAPMLRATIAENIALSAPHAEEGRIEEAARLAKIHGRITSLPRGYQSVVGDDAQLSAGERQRIALARALLADSSILILDEATSFADPLTEHALRDAVKSTGGERTTMIIAHRRETVAAADRIVVLEDGRIIEAGAREQIIAPGGPLAALWETPRADEGDGAR